MNDAMLKTFINCCVLFFTRKKEILPYIGKKKCKTLWTVNKYFLFYQTTLNQICFILIRVLLNSDLVALKVTLAMLGKFGITASYAIIYLMAAEVFPTVVR